MKGEERPVDLGNAQGGTLGWVLNFCSSSPAPDPGGIRVERGNCKNQIKLLKVQGKCFKIEFRASIKRGSISLGAQHRHAAHSSTRSSEEKFPPSEGEEQPLGA